MTRTCPRPGEILAMLVPADPAKAVAIVAVHPQRLAGAIGAEYFELVRHPWLSDRDLVLVVDEEGLLTRRPANPRVTAVWHPHIVGDVLVCAEGMTDDGPDLVGLSPFQVAMVVGLMTDVDFRLGFARQVEDEADRLGSRAVQ